MHPEDIVFILLVSFLVIIIAVFIMIAMRLKKKEENRIVKRYHIRDRYPYSWWWPGYNERRVLRRLRRGGLKKFENCDDVCKFCLGRGYEDCDEIYGCDC
tara:strand:+ start:1850 stop:2149 length:300 start_codon:yes stop_codon:yes gene_type:complete